MGGKKKSLVKDQTLGAALVEEVTWSKKDLLGNTLHTANVWSLGAVACFL